MKPEDMVVMDVKDFVRLLQQLDAFPAPEPDDGVWYVSTVLRDVCLAEAH